MTFTKASKRSLVRQGILCIEPFRGGQVGAKASGAVQGKGKNFWAGKAPRPDLMGGPAPGGAVQGKGRNFWAGKAPRPDLMPPQTGGAAVQGKALATSGPGGARSGVPRPELPAAMHRRAVLGALQRMTESPSHDLRTWKQTLPEAVGIGQDWRFDRVIDEQDYLEYKQYLKLWSVHAKKQMKTDGSVFALQRSEIAKGSSGSIRTCTPESWGIAEETTCVCDDLLEQACVDLDENEEVQYVIYYQGAAIGVITLNDGCDYSGIENSGEDFTITGLVKALGAQGSLRQCIPRFLSVLMKKTGKRGVVVASAKGAVTAYGRYGFVNTKVSANHYDYACGCTVLYLDAKRLSSLL